MMQLVFPTSPSVGDKFSSDMFSWTFDGDKWVSGGGGADEKGIEDAPNDGLLYGRRNEAWSYIPIPDIPEYTAIVPLGGRLDLVGSSPSNQIRFSAFNGDWIRINGKDYPIPVGGITSGRIGVYIDGVVGHNLANHLVYYVYVFDNNGTLTIEFSTTGHETSTTQTNANTEIKIGDPSRSLIGMVRLSSGLFYSARESRFVRSWFNRPPMTLLRVGQFVSGTNIWWNSANAEFLCFKDEVSFIVASIIGMNGTMAANNVGVSLDNALPVTFTAWSGTATQSAVATASEILTEGFHTYGYAVFTNGGNIDANGQIVGTVG